MGSKPGAVTTRLTTHSYIKGYNFPIDLSILNLNIVTGEGNTGGHQLVGRQRQSRCRRWNCGRRKIFYSLSDSR